MSRIDDYAIAIEQVLIDRKLIAGPIPWRQWAGPDFFGCDAYGFEIDMPRFQVKRIEALHSQATLKAISTRLGGIKVGYANTQGFLYLIKNEPVPELLDFPERIPLPAPPDKNYLIPFGVTKEGRAQWRSVFDTLNIVVGGSTRRGKTAGFFSWYSALVQQHTPAELQFAIVDGKRFEFLPLNGSPYLIDNVATEADTAIQLIERVWGIVQDRTRLFAKHKVGNLEMYSKKTGQRLPIVILLIDEVKELIDAGMDTKTLGRILQQGAGLGIYVFEGTQKPDSKTINKTNFNTFVAYRLSNVYDCQIIFGNHDAYHILKNGQPGELCVLGPDLNYAHLKAFWAEKDMSESPVMLDRFDKILVAIAVKKFDGYCPLDRIIKLIQTELPPRYQKAFTRHALQIKFADWETIGWLESAKRQDDGIWLARRVTDELRERAGV